MPPAPTVKSQSHQALQIEKISLAAGEVVTVDLAEKRNAKVNWDGGGVSWTIKESAIASATFEVKVEQSLLPAGFDDADDWSDDLESPFTEADQGSEIHRISRIRFSNAAGSHTVTIIVASNAKFTVDFA